MLQNQRGSLAPKILVAGGGFALIVAILLVVWGFQVSNSEIRLRNKIGGENQVIEAYFDKMWKIIKQQAGVANEYKESFRAIYKDLMAGRYSGEGKGEMMLWIKESNPQFETTLFEKLMVSIEAQREGFFVAQKKIVDMIVTHKDMITTVPSSMIVGGRDLIVYEVISSSTSKKVMETRTEDDIELFDKKKKE